MIGDHCMERRKHILRSNRFRRDLGREGPSMNRSSRMIAPVFERPTREE